MRDALADHEVSKPENQADEHQDAEVERNHEVGVCRHDADAVQGNLGRHGRKDCNRSDCHDRRGDLEHDVRDHVEVFDEGLGTVTKRARGYPEEQSKHHNLQNLVLGHGVNNAGREDVLDEPGQTTTFDFKAMAGVFRGKRQVQALAWFQDLDHDQTQNQREYRHHDKPAKRLGGDASDRPPITNTRHADDQRGEHQWCDDHLDQSQKNIGQQRNILGVGLCEAIFMPPGEYEVPDDDAKNHGTDDEMGHFSGCHCRHFLLC